MENKQTQYRIRQLVYRNLDSLFEELNELNQKTFLASKFIDKSLIESESNGGKDSKEKK